MLLDSSNLVSDKLGTVHDNIKKDCQEVDEQNYKKRRARLICDYIAGMTDDYATRLYEKIYYPHKGSIFDRM